MDVPIDDGSERDRAHRQVLALGTLSTAWVTPRLCTAMRAAWVGDRWSASGRRGAAAGSLSSRRACRSSSLVGVAV